MKRNNQWPPNAPRRPSDLPRSTHRLWRDVVEHLDALGILSPAIGPQLETYCLAHLSYVRASAYFRRHGLLAKHRREAMQVLRHALRIQRQCSADFGMTPLARHRLMKRGVISADAIERVTCRRSE